MSLDWRPPAEPSSRTDEYYLEADLPGGGRAYIYTIGGMERIEARIRDRHCWFERSSRGLIMAKRWAERIGCTTSS